MNRTSARLPDDISELCLIRLGVQSRKISALPYLFRLGRAIERSSREAIAAGAGLLHSDLFRIAWNHFGVLQYWRSFEELEAWSHTSPHADWWREASERLRTKADFAIYHETFLVPRDSIESIYMNALPTGLLAFGATGEPAGLDANSRGRLRREKTKSSADDADQF